MKAERDPLRALLRALAAAEPPEPADELAECDAATRAAVEALRAAWTAVEPPAPPALASRRPERRPEGPRRRVAIAAAAAALLAFAAAVAAGVALLWDPERGREPDREVARDEEPRPAEPGPPAAGPPRGVTLARVAPDRIEMTSGSVRLVVLTAAPAQEDLRTEDPRNPR